MIKELDKGMVSVERIRTELKQKKSFLKFSPFWRKTLNLTRISGAQTIIDKLPHLVSYIIIILQSLYNK